MSGKSLRLVACALFLLTIAAPARAVLAPERIAEMLAAAVTATGEAELAFDGTTADGDTVTVTGLKLSVAAEDSTVAVPTVVITGAAPREAGGFTAARIAFNGGTATSPDVSVTWRSATLDNAIVPSADEVKARARLRPFGRLTFTGLDIVDSRVPDPIAIAELTVEIDEITEGAPSDIRIRAAGARLPASIVTNPIGANLLSGLGYKEIVADVTMDSDYDVAADTVVVHALTIDAVDVGRIEMTARFSGLSFRGLSDPEEAAAARAAARLDAMTVRFDDAGFVGRMLDMQADMLGGTRDEVREQLVYGALPFALSFVEDVSFREQFLAAVSAFLEKPHSITVSVAPGAPVPLGQVVRTAVRTPTQLPDLLTPDVVAND